MVSERLFKDVTDCIIRDKVLGSDHCPLVLGLALPSSQETEATADPKTSENTDT